MIPITRIDEYLAVISQDEDATGLPDQAVTRIDMYLSKIAGEAVAELPEPVTRIDRYLASIAGMDVVMDDPITRIDYYLATVAGVYSGELPEPVTRIDHYLYNWANGGGMPDWQTFVGNPLQFDAPKAHTLKSVKVSFEASEDGYTGANVYLEDEYDASAVPVATVTFHTTIYGGWFDFISGAGEDENGEAFTATATEITCLQDLNTIWTDGTNLSVEARGIGWDNATWQDVVLALELGLTVPNGVEFTVHNEYYGDIDFIVRRSNVDKVSGSPTTPTTTVQCKYLLSDDNGNSAISLQYDRPEAFTAPLESAIAANSKVKFSLNVAYGSWTVGSYQFTPDVQLPVGTALCMSGYQNTALTALKVQAYTDRTCKTKIGEWAVSASDGTESVDLGDWQNHPQRVSHGSNNEAESNVFQMLNGIGLMRDIWEPKTPYDLMTSNYNNATRYGFLGGFPEDFRQHLGLAVIDNITNNVFECPPMEKNKAFQHTGYIWLPSRKEIYGSNENANEADETQFPYFEETGTTDADKLMYAKNAVNPKSYWLRTPYAGTANNVRICDTGHGGGLYSSGALGSVGLGPLAILVP